MAAFSGRKLRVQGLPKWCLGLASALMIKIVDCDNSECPGDWQSLSVSGDDDIRTCGVCLRAVFRCQTEEDLLARREAGQQAALDGN